LSFTGGGGGGGCVAETLLLNDLRRVGGARFLLIPVNAAPTGDEIVDSLAFC